MSNLPVPANTYLIKLTLYIGAYEKQTTHVLRADSADEASEQALINESHNDDAAWDGDQWIDGEFSYSVYDVTDINGIDGATLAGRI